MESKKLSKLLQTPCQSSKNLKISQKKPHRQAFQTQITLHTPTLISNPPQPNPSVESPNSSSSLIISLKNSLFDLAQETNNFKNLFEISKNSKVKKVNENHSRDTLSDSLDSGSKAESFGVKDQTLSNLKETIQNLQRKIATSEQQVKKTNSENEELKKLVFGIAEKLQKRNSHKTTQKQSCNII